MDYVVTDRYYQPHHTGIEITAREAMATSDENYQPHHTGIEIRLSFGAGGINNSINRTILELKWH